MFVRSLGALPIFLIPAIFGLPTGYYGIAAGLSIWFVLNDMNFLLHQHVHCPWTCSPFINRIIDGVLSLVTGMSAYNWRLSHLLRHHQGDDSWGKGFPWEMERPSMLGAISYSVRGVPIVFLYPLIQSFVSGFVRHEKGIYSFRIAFLEQMCVAMFIGAMLYISPAFYGTYYIAVLSFSRLVDYQNHVGCDEHSPYGFSNNAFSECYNWVRCNFGYHTAHHYHPHAHWTELPTLHDRLAPKIPQERMSSGSWTGLLTPPLIAYWLLRLFRLKDPSLRKVDVAPSVEQA